MKSRKRRTAPVVILMLLGVLISLGAGLAVGRGGTELANTIKDMMKKRT